MNEPEFIVWMDFETSGLDVNRDRILEIGCVTTDLDLHVVSQFHILHLPEDIWSMPMDEVVHDMHTKNGLFNELVSDGKPWPEVHSRFYQYLIGIGDGNDAPLILGGYGVSHMEKHWLRNYFVGHWEDLFTYWDYDVSVVRRLIKSVRPDKVWLDKDDNHRALMDAHRALFEWRYFASLLKEGLF